jgi:hypothetical protein
MVDPLVTYDRSESRSVTATLQPKESPRQTEKKKERRALVWTSRCKAMELVAYLTTRSSCESLSSMERSSKVGPPSMDPQEPARAALWQVKFLGGSFRAFRRPGEGRKQSKQGLVLRFCVPPPRSAPGGRDAKPQILLLLFVLLSPYAAIDGWHGCGSHSCFMHSVQMAFKAALLGGVLTVGGGALGWAFVAPSACRGTTRWHHQHQHQHQHQFLQRFAGRDFKCSVAGGSRRAGRISPWLLRASSAQVGSDTTNALPEAFARICDADGRLDLEGFLSFGEVADLLADGLLEEREVNAIWTKIAGGQDVSLDERGFIKVFRIIDSMFEEEEDIEEDGEGTASGKNAGSENPESAGSLSSSEEDLRLAFQSLTRLAKSPTLSKKDILQWREVRDLISTGLLTESEVGQIFDTAHQSTGARDGKLGLEGFIEVGLALDGMFEEVEEEEGGGMQDYAKEKPSLPQAQQPKQVEAVGEVAPENAILEEEFLRLVGSRQGALVSLPDLFKWGEISELIADNQLDAAEVRDIYAKVPKAADAIGLDLSGFIAFNKELDKLFVFDEEDEEVEAKEPVDGAAAVAKAEASASEATANLKDLLGKVNDESILGGEKAFRQSVVRAVNQLVSACEGIPPSSPTANVVNRGGGEVLSQILGKWELLYATSSSLEFHSGLTGLGNTLPNARFVGLRQILTKDNDVLDGIYEEQLEVAGKPLLVTVTADWELRETRSIITDETALSLEVFTQRVQYGFIDVIGERWKALRSMRLLDVLYMGDGLRIMRGQTSSNTIFVWKRID